MVLVEFLRASRRFPTSKRGRLEFQEFDCGCQLAIGERDALCISVRQRHGK